MDIDIIKTSAECATALNEIDGLMGAELGTPEGARLDALATLVEAYEAKHFSDLLQTVQAQQQHN